MFALGFKMLLRGKSTFSSILAIMFLVTILASVYSIANHVSFQTESLVKYSGSDGSYLILSVGSKVLSDSQIDDGILGQLKNMSQIKYILPQKVISAKIISSHKNCSVNFRCVEDVEVFLKFKKVFINGTFAKSFVEANVGEVLAKLLCLNVGDKLTILVYDDVFCFNVVGIFRSQTQADSEILVSMDAAKNLTGDCDSVSFIEFALKEDVCRDDAINYVTEILPEYLMVVETRQLKNFVREMNSQTLTLLNFWSIIVYAVVALASYIITLRYVSESSYMLAMLKAIGSKRHHILVLILTYSMFIALAGSVLGIALGVTGSQAASAVYRWLQSFEVSTFLEVDQVFQILLSTLISSFFGCIYPAIKAARTRYVEQILG